ncbi:MAG: transporter substrate-binding domain-containing protein, partial [Spirochaetales bacterium]|nr:transporter substrate-binding domain-containing protein [Spirochaetales bacterium]
MIPAKLRFLPLYLFLILSPLFSSEKIRIALPESTGPFSALQSDGSPAGLLVDIWKTWGEKTGSPVEFLILPAGECIEALNDGRADICGFHVPDREPVERDDQREFDLSGPYYAADSGLYVGRY